MSSLDTDENDLETSGPIFDSQDPRISLVDQQLVSTDGIDASRSEEQRQSARALVQREVLRAQRAISYLHYRHNLMLPISRLPPEVLSRIFWELRVPLWPMRPRCLPRGCWIFLTHVCRTWRTTALGCAGLWAEIPLRLGQKWAQAFVARSEAITLSITVMNGLSEPYWKYNIISSQVSRVGNLGFSELKDSDVATIFRVLGSCIPERLMSLRLLPYSQPSNITVQPEYARILHRMPKLQNIALTGIPLPWDALPWARLRSVEIVADTPNLAQADLALLVASLASATALEKLQLTIKGCPFATDVQPQAAIAHLSQLQSFQFDGYAADFQRLSGAMRIPLTSKLNIVLRSNDLRVAEASVVSALLRAHSGSSQQQPDNCIQALQLSTDRERHAVYLRAWQSDAECASAMGRRHPFIHIYLSLSPGEQMVDSQMAALCQNIELGSLRQLCLLLDTIEVDDEEDDTLWDESTYRALFASARSVDCLQVEGRDVHALFEALSTLDANQENPPSEAAVLFPSLRHIHLIDFDEQHIFGHYSPSNLPGWIQARSQHAPIVTLDIQECSVSEDTVERLSAIEGLVLEWDGKHGRCSTPSSDAG